MSRLVIFKLTGEKPTTLRKSFRHVTNHVFRTRCHMILLKADHLPSAQVFGRVGCCVPAVNGWIRRCQAKGIGGFKADLQQARRRAEPPLEDHPCQS